MRIDNISLKNFRNFESFSASFHKNMTVVVGDNGAGKSSLLDALSIAIGSFFIGFDSVPAPRISKDDATIKCYDMGSVVDLQHQFPVSIQAVGEINDRTISWLRELNSAEGNTTMIGAKAIAAISMDYKEKIRQGDKDTVLPFISYYGAGRLWAKKRKKTATSTLSKFSRQSGYIDCIAAESNEKMMLKWFEKMTIQEAQNKTVSLEFSAVKKAISTCFDGITGYKNTEAEFNLDTHSIDILFMDETGARKRFSLRDLSDGYRSALSMIGDIAYRMAVLNPQLLGSVLEMTPGIVLIDEIDLHLHPKWQQRILGDLRTIFPKIQFIVSTHAPSVISSVKRENLLILSGDNQAALPVTEVYGSDANSILSSVMGASERPEEIKKMFEALHKALDDDQIEEAKKQLKKIVDLIGEDDREVISANVAIDFAEM